MSNAELIKALRYCAEHEGCDYYNAKDCPIESTWMCGVDCGQILMLDAADAIEAADKRIAELEAQMPKEGEWMPVVRCLECRHNKGEKVWRDGEVTIDCDNGMGYPPPNFFCADGERRTE